MLTHYPEIPKVEKDRAGESWLACDEADCTAEVKVDGSPPDTCASCGAKASGRFCANCGAVLAVAIPKGWVTSNPDDDPLQGAAQFCPKHADRVVLPAADAPPPIVEPPAKPEG